MKTVQQPKKSIKQKHTFIKNKINISTKIEDYFNNKQQKHFNQTVTQFQ